MVNSMGKPQTASTREVHKSKKIQFSIMSQEEILKNSVCEITHTLIYNKETGLPAENGMNDPRMGVTMKGIVCQTCFGDLKECPGHFGHIKLAEYVYHHQFIETVYKILRCVCYQCSKLLITPDKIPSVASIKGKKRRFHEIQKQVCRTCFESETGEESGCGLTQPRYYRSKNSIVIKPVGREEMVGNIDRLKQQLKPSEAYHILKNITDANLKILGLNSTHSRPENMIIKFLIVSPPSVRPSIELSSSARSEDDLTQCYQTILATNIELIKAQEAGFSRSKLDEITTRLQQYVSSLINNDDNKAKQKSGRPIKAITQRLKGKEGRLRGNLMGKRVDFSSRTVISPDPSLELDQLGVPKEIAQELTIPETVTQLNIDFLKGLVERGDEWPGARYYISSAADGEVIDLNYVKQKPTLQYGDIIERHLMDGDYVIFNRQPSLHRMSIMGHRVKILPGLTFRLNLAVTTPYNADFDGDEMNMHAPQNLETLAEVKYLMHIPKQIVTPQSNRPVMGLNQDALLACRLMTLQSVFLTYEQVSDILMNITNWDGVLPKPAIVYPQALWTGKQMVSLIIPKTNYNKVNNSDLKNFYQEESSVIIRKGELVTGLLNKGIVGNTRGSFIGCIWLDFGPERTRQFFTDLQKIVNTWLLIPAFTVGISDTIIPSDIMERISKATQEANRQFHYVLQDTQKDIKKLIVHQPGKTIIQSFEHKVNSLLNDCRGEIGKMLNDTIGNENHIKQMILAGSKGNNINISQISGMVGQQNVEGQRIRFGFNKRTLPHFLKDDFGLESRGFVANSYYKGLTPQEFFFHTMGGREGIIDTAVKTSYTGYMQRRLVKAMEDIMVQYDFTVRDSHGCLVQYIYGEDGFAGEFVEDQKFDLIELSDELLAKKCCFFELNEGKGDMGFRDSLQKYFDKGVIDYATKEALLKEKESQQILFEEYEAIAASRNKLREVFRPGFVTSALPVNVDRLISYALMKGDNIGGKVINPLEVIRLLNQTLSRLEVINVQSVNMEQQEFSQQVNERATYILKSFIRYKLCSKRVVLELKMTQQAFQYLLNEIELAFNKSRSHPGEMTGSIAAQSLGETLTQMTLNTFHFAGISAVNVTLGVPRIQEIINCTKNIKGPAMCIYLQEDVRFSETAARQLISKLEQTTLVQLARKSEIYYDPDPLQTVIKEDEFLIPMEEDLREFSPWLLRIEIDPLYMIRKGIRFGEIIDMIHQQLGKGAVDILHSLETENPLIIRIRLMNKGENDNQDIKKIEQFILEDMTIKGFCKKVSYRQQKVSVYTKEGVKQIGEGQGEYILETSGTNLSRILKIDTVDPYRTTSNDIQDIYTVFGVEAARCAIMKEIKTVLDFFNIYVNYRHVTILADIITQNGRLMSISRTGINRVYQSPFRKCSFEETVEILIEAAVFSEVEGLKGVTENIMMGQLCRMGTGAFDIIMDNSCLIPKKDANDKEKENMMAQWKYFPDKAPIFDPNTDMNNGPQFSPDQMQTPFSVNQFDNCNIGVSPIYVKGSSFFSPSLQSPSMMPREGNIQQSPKYIGNMNQSPIFLAEGANKGQFQPMQSPYLYQQTPPGLPKEQEGIQGQFDGQSYKYSPMSPRNYISPMSIKSNKSNKYGAPSPIFKQQQSPQYTPQSKTPSSVNSYPQTPQNNQQSPLSDDYNNYLDVVKNFNSPQYFDNTQGEKKEDYYNKSPKNE